MKSKDVEKKSYYELKWASYLFICSIILSFIYNFLQLIIFKQNRNSFIVLLLLQLIILIYFSFKCIEEFKRDKIVTFISKIKIIINILIMNYMFISLFSTNSKFIIPKRELEIQESSEELSNSNLIKDFIAFVKIKNKKTSANNGL